MAALESFRQAMASADPPQTPDDIARLLGASVRGACADLGFLEAEIYFGGPIVTMLLTPRDPWEAVVVGPDAYQLYPGFIRDEGETIVWPNIWVADNYSLAIFLERLESEFARIAAANS